MAKLQIKGQVVYPPGPWGFNKPVANAKITVQDIDFPGKGNDTIFTGTTDADGHFSGTSKEWQDKTSIKYWRIKPGFPPTGEWVTKSIPDPTDVLVLNIKIEADGEQMTILFGNTDVLPIPVTWLPPWPPSGYGTLNGVEFDDTQALLDALINAIEAKEQIELELVGDWADEVQALVNLINTPPLELAQQLFPGSQAGSLELILGSAVITISAAALAELAPLVLAIGGLVLMTGAAVFVSALGIAVILAVIYGYCVIDAEQTTTNDQNGNPNNSVLISLKNMGC